MKRTKLAAAILAFTTMALSITGCGANFDAKAYVEGTLNAAFKNDISDELADMTIGGREALEADYEESVNMIVSDYEAIGCPADLLDDYTNVTKDLLNACKYTVGDAVKDEDGNYTVPVTIEPLDLSSAGAEDELTAFTNDLLAEGITDEAALMNAMFEFILAEMQGYVSSPQYSAETTKDVHVVINSDKLYEIPEDELTALVTAMMGQ